MNNQVTNSISANIDFLQTEPIAPRTALIGFCPLCGERFSDKLFTIPDRLHRTPGEFTYRRCRSCRTVFQDPRVIAEDLPLCYPKQYYTHSHQASAATQSNQGDNLTSGLHKLYWQRMIRDRLREAIKAEVQGQKLPGVWGRIGKISASSPLLRKRAFYGLVEDDFLPRTPRYPKALDVGCGAGRRMIELKKVWDVEGVEWDPIAAEVARQTSKCYVWHGDFRQLDLPLGS
ncbi:MAG: class I SAM-dependent methyltransferase, partial [Nitrososphaera sp.]|nr:class I SAM-dependent methyltransferase [Nitrososphaera sp.]